MLPERVEDPLHGEVGGQRGEGEAGGHQQIGAGQRGQGQVVQLLPRRRHQARAGHAQATFDNVYIYSSITHTVTRYLST